ncbi:MAG: Holliday junction resolvase RuvX [Candidatus Saganbacteria bacterium]|nr:Holliday junction resolvase RuvX [Candidatus Saganbacteria bacterium]
MRILSLDVGEKRIGLALSDPLGFSAQPFKTINCTGDQDADLEQVLIVVREFEVKKIVVGCPKSLKERVTPQTEKVRIFIGQLKTKTDIPIIEWDERLSTKAAERQLREMDVIPSKRKQKVDQLAACFILEGYLQKLKQDIKKI